MLLANPQGGTKEKSDKMKVTSNFYTKSILLWELNLFHDMIDLLHTISIILYQVEFFVPAQKLTLILSKKISLLEGYGVVPKIEKKAKKASSTGTDIGDDKNTRQSL